MNKGHRNSDEFSHDVSLKLGLNRFHLTNRMSRRVCRVFTHTKHLNIYGKAGKREIGCGKWSYEGSAHSHITVSTI